MKTMLTDKHFTSAESKVKGAQGTPSATDYSDRNKKVYETLMQKEGSNPLLYVDEVGLPSIEIDE